MSKWVLKLYRRSDNQIQSLHGSSSTSPAPRSKLIPNMYHEFDFNMSENELCEWILDSEKISNVLMTIGAVETWGIYNEND